MLSKLDVIMSPSIYEDSWLESLKSRHSGNFEQKHLVTFIRQMPKIELHAHLNGCIRESTLLELANERNVSLSSLLHDVQEECHPMIEEKRVELQKVNRKRRSLLECFEIFGEISNCVTDLAALRRIAMEALEDFAKDGVVYLELRSTPKILFLDGTKGKKCTKREYVEAILRVMREFEEKDLQRYHREIKQNWNNDDDSLIRLPMKARFILSINRADSVEDAMEHAQLAIDLTREDNKYVVGVDLSGNPMKNLFKDLEPSLQRARDSGLQMCIHCGEIPIDSDNVDPIQEFAYQDTKNILAFRPDRLGHALLLTAEMFDELETNLDKIPIECCPTSNVMTLELATHFKGDLVHGLIGHPRLEHWIDTNYPISISTDDPGIFNTNPTSELLLVLETLKMDNPWQILAVVFKSIDQIFESNEFKDELRSLFMNHIKVLTSTLSNV